MFELADRFEARELAAWRDDTAYPTAGGGFADAAQLK